MSYTKKETNVDFIADKSTEIKNEPRKKEVKSPTNFEINQKPSTLDSPENKSFQNVQKNKEELKFFGVSEYYIKETVIPTGYEADESIYRFRVAYDETSNKLYIEPNFKSL